MIHLLQIYASNHQVIYIIFKIQIQGKFVVVAGNSRWAAIVEYARKHRATMVVVTSRELCPQLRPHDDVIADISQTSVTKDVLMHCQCPVLVARPPGAFGRG